MTGHYYLIITSKLVAVMGIKGVFHVQIGSLNYFLEIALENHMTTNNYEFTKAQNTKSNSELLHICIYIYINLYNK